MTLAPWCVNEKWDIGLYPDGRRYARVSGRERCPEALRKNVGWWFRNDYEQTIAEAPWYHPDWSEAKRQLFWNLRNPLRNYLLFVVGVADRNYTVEVLTGNPDPMCVQRDDYTGPDGQPEYGWQKSVLKLDDGSIRNWVSYCDKRMVWYHGHQPTGTYGIKLNFHAGS